MFEWWDLTSNFIDYVYIQRDRHVFTKFQLMSAILSTKDPKVGLNSKMLRCLLPRIIYMNKEE